LNFRFLMLLFLISACGVKGDPASPKSEKLPSLMNNYPDINLDNSFDEHKKMKR